MRTKGYIIASSSSTAEQRAAIDKINRTGGVTRRITLGSALLGATIAIFIVWMLLPMGLATFPILAVAAATMAVGYFGYAKPLYETTAFRWTSTDDPDLMALDREWLAIIAQENEPAWAAAEDQRRFTTLRRIAEMSSADAAAEIAKQRDYLRHGTT